MKRVMRIACDGALIAAIAAVLLAAACGFHEDQLAGGTTTETEALIMGTVSRTDGSPAAAARVRIRHAGYLPSHLSDSAVEGDVTADSAGRFRYNPKDSGLFDLEAAFGDTLGALIRNISPGKEAQKLAAGLDTNGALTLKLETVAPGVTYVLRAFGLERYERADTAGNFRIELPAGEYRMLITGGSGDAPLVLENVKVEKGKDALIDSLRFPQLDSGLLGYWPFEEGSGESISDQSGNGHTGAAKGIKWMEGKVGGAVQFTEGQGFIDVGAPTPDVFAFAQDSDYTFAAWAKLGNKIPNHGVARRIISKQKNPGFAMFLRIFPDGNPGFGSNPVKPAAKPSAAAAAVGVRDLKAPVDVADGGWHHLAGVSRKGRLMIYVDGVLKASAMNDSIKTVNTYTDYNDKSPDKYADPGLDGHLVIGCVESGQDGFDGLIDEVRIYGRAITAAEALQLARPYIPR